VAVRVRLRRQRILPTLWQEKQVVGAVAQLVEQGIRRSSCRRFEPGPSHWESGHLSFLTPSGVSFSSVRHPHLLTKGA
jgi:hypothetical protein